MVSSLTFSPTLSCPQEAYHGMGRGSVSHEDLAGVLRTYSFYTSSLCPYDTEEVLPTT